jgi:membrane protease YdiL (CAAX protease family)
MFAVLITLSMFSAQFLPGILVSDDRRALVLSGVAIAVAAGTVEELGWTGFAIPRLRRQHGVVTTGLIVGCIWAAWHVLVAVWASGSVSGELSLVSYVLDPFLFLLPFRVLMVWVYDRSGSVLLAMLMHVSLTASARIIGAARIAGLPLLLSDLVWFAAVWAVVAVIAMTNGWTLSQQPLERQAA